MIHIKNNSVMKLKLSEYNAKTNQNYRNDLHRRYSRVIRITDTKHKAIMKSTKHKQMKHKYKMKPKD